MHGSPMSRSCDPRALPCATATRERRCMVRDVSSGVAPTRGNPRSDCHGLTLRLRRLSPPIAVTRRAMPKRARRRVRGRVGVNRRDSKTPGALGDEGARCDLHHQRQNHYISGGMGVAVFTPPRRGARVSIGPALKPPAVGGAYGSPMAVVWQLRQPRPSERPKSPAWF